ncbi:beta-ketoacyl-[acyl-carrier-protein] synthase family protein [Streptomyces sp. NPDC059193]|uniref:beta-ketoacyl-[acyl-carrier-protein] synthase family protein n=1 Tax=Streptomyces sp. NPDC059193 TaxID=3346763 RepID=UPI003681F60F
MRGAPAEPFRAAVTGLGLVTPAGVGVDENWKRVLSAVPTASADPGLAGLPVDFSCRVPPDFDPAAVLGRRTAWRLGRHVQLGMVAAREALRDCGLDSRTWDGARVGVVMGNSLGGTATFEQQCLTLRDKGAQAVSPMFISMWGANMVAGHIAIDCRAGGPNLVVTTACASGGTALGVARDLLRSGTCDIVLAGGTEAALSRTIVAGLASMGVLSRRSYDPPAAFRPFDVDRDGFVAAEGAGVLVLEREADARARGARVRACISGYGGSADAVHQAAPDPDGSGFERALRTALSDAGLSGADVDHVNTHGTATELNDIGETRVLRRVLGPRPAVTSTKGVTGHCIAAAGAIEAVYTVLSIEQGLVPPVANLERLDPRIDADIVQGSPRAMPVEVAVNVAFGLAGQNAVVVLTAA